MAARQEIANHNALGINICCGRKTKPKAHGVAGDAFGGVRPIVHNRPFSRRICCPTLLRDITEQKHAEAALRAAEARFRTLIEQIPAIIYTAAIDTHSSTSYVSPQIEAILGFTPAEWLANPDLWLEQVYPDDRPRMLETIGHAHTSDRPPPIEFRSYTRDGRVVWLRDAARVVRDDTGQPLFMQGITLDITERKLAEAELAAVNAELATAAQTATELAAAADTANYAKSAFLANMSHEIRTPMSWMDWRRRAGSASSTHLPPAHGSSR